MTELLNCPFCGDAPEIIDRDFRIPFVECVECGIEKAGDMLEEAITAWNTRHPSPETKTMTEESRKAQAFGELLLSMMAEFNDAEASLPEGLEPDELTNIISASDGDWKITVSRPTAEDDV